MVYEKVVSVVGPVAGIGGIAIASAVYVFRSVIAREIFPQLTKRHAFEIIRLIVVFTFLLGLVGIGSWVYVGIDRPHKKTDTKPQSDPLPTQTSVAATNNKQIIETAAYGDTPILTYEYPEDWVDDNTLAPAIYKREADGEPRLGFRIIVDRSEIPFDEFPAYASKGDPAGWNPVTRAKFVAQMVGEGGSAVSREVPLFDDPTGTSFDRTYEVIDYAPPGTNDRDGSEEVLRSLYVFGGAKTEPPYPDKKKAIVYYHQLTCKAPAVNWKLVRADCDAVIDSVKLSIANSPDIANATDEEAPSNSAAKP